MSELFLRYGVIEGYTGPMASGKSSIILKRVDPLRWMPDANYIGFKPDTDSREKQSRSTENFIDWIYIPSNDPKEILKHVKENHDLVVIDEIQFFNEGIVETLLNLQSQMKNIIFAGLDSDFRGEPFGSMKELMFHANKLKKLYAICPSCGDKAYYTQRLIDGEPANYDSPVVSVEGEGERETYEPRCFKHHEVPGKE